MKWHRYVGITLAVIIMAAGFFRTTSIPRVKKELTEVQVEYIADYLKETTEISEKKSITSEEEMEKLRQIVNKKALKLAAFSHNGFKDKGQKLECIRVTFWVQEQNGMSCRRFLLFGDGTILADEDKCYVPVWRGKQMDLFEYFLEKYISPSP